MIRFPYSRGTLVFSGVLVLMTVGLLFASGGNIGAAIVPVVVIAVLAAIICLPLRHTAMALLAIQLLVHCPGVRPMAGLWKGPLFALGPLLYTSLQHYTRIPVFKFSLIESGYLLLLIVMGIRSMMGRNIDRQYDMPAAKPMKIGVLLSMASLILAVMWGKIRGGSSFEIVFQARSLFFLVIMIVVSMRAFKTEKDFRRLGVLLVVITTIRVIEGVYFYFSFVRPRGLALEYIMTHSDTVPFVAIELLLLSRLLETQRTRALLHLVFVGGFIMYGMILNDRRIAYVSLAMGLVVLFVFVQARIRRWLMRAILATLPITLLYIAIGLNSSAAIFAPVRNLASVTDEADASNYTRNVENYNIIETIRTNPILGTGYGHGYNELLFSFSIAASMPNYIYHPHNSLLGLLMFSGVIGLYFIWIYLPIGVFLAARAYKTATTPTQRTTAVTVICIVIIHMLQCFGDMGIESLDQAGILAPGLGCVANLVMRTGGLSDRSG